MPRSELKQAVRRSPKQEHATPQDTSRCGHSRQPVPAGGQRWTIAFVDGPSALATRFPPRAAARGDLPRVSGGSRSGLSRGDQAETRLRQPGECLAQLLPAGPDGPSPPAVLAGRRHAAMAKAFRTIRNFTDRLRQAFCTATGPPLGGCIDAAAIPIRFSSAAIEQVPQRVGAQVGAARLAQGVDPRVEAREEVSADQRENAQRVRPGQSSAGGAAAARFRASARCVETCAPMIARFSSEISLRSSLSRRYSATHCSASSTRSTETYRLCVLPRTWRLRIWERCFSPPRAPGGWVPATDPDLRQGSLQHRPHVRQLLELGIPPRLHHPDGQFRTHDDTPCFGARDAPSNITTCPSYNVKRKPVSNV